MKLNVLAPCLLALALNTIANAAYDGLSPTPAPTARTTAAPSSGSGELADRVVAKVNDSAITLSELEEAVIARRLADPQSRTSSPRQIYEEELASLIDEELIYQAAKQSGIEAPPEMVAERVKEDLEMLQQSAGSREQLDAMLAGQNLTLDKLKSLMQRRQTRELTIVRAITSRFTITEADVKEFEAALRAQGQSAMGYGLRHILIAVPKGATATQVSQLREEAYQAALKAQTEMSFGEAARQFSQDAATREIGGDLGYVAEGSMMPELERVVKALKVGQVSQPVRSETGWHVFKLESLRSPRKALFVRRFEEERQKMTEQLRRTMTVETQMEFLEQIPKEPVQGQPQG